MDPILAQFVGKKADFGVKKRVFLKKICSDSFFIASQMVWDPQKPKIDPVDPPVDPILAHFVGKKADFGVKIRVFLKYVFSSKMTFLGSSDRVSLGSMWFWYLQNDNMYTLGTSESPNEVGKGPRRAKNGP